MDTKIINEIKRYENQKLALHHASFFKTGKGQYGEGDLFLGISVPILRQISKKYFKEVSLNQLESLLQNPYHEIRICSLMMMVLKYQKTEDKEKIFNIYMQNLKYINNWDLVDVSAQYIVGPFLYDSIDVLLDLAKSNHLWSQRIAIIATFYNIRQGSFKNTIELSKYFLTHKHDLIHKATGWMLREVGKRDLNLLIEFLDKHHKTMPRTMLRYSIEKLTAEQKKFYMNK